MDLERLKDIIGNLNDADQVELTSYLLSNPSTEIKAIEKKAEFSMLLIEFLDVPGQQEIEH